MTTTAVAIEGRIDTLRVAVPAIRGHVHLRVDGVPVLGEFEDPAVIRCLRGVHEQGLHAIVGVLADARGDGHFSWLIAPQGPCVPPRTYQNEWRKGRRQIGIGLAVAGVALAAAWWLGVASFPRTLLMTLALAVALVALALSWLTAQSLWSNRRHRHAILQSEAQYRECLQHHPQAQQPAQNGSFATAMSAPPAKPAKPAFKYPGKRRGR